MPGAVILSVALLTALSAAAPELSDLPEAELLRRAQEAFRSGVERRGEPEAAKTEFAEAAPESDLRAGGERDEMVHAGDAELMRDAQQFKVGLL